MTYPQQMPYREAPMPPTHVGSKTVKGVEYFLWSLYILLIFGVLSVIIGIIAWISMSTPASGGSPMMAGTAVSAIVALGCGILILLVIYLIFLILGASSLNSEKIRYGPAHTSSVSKGVMFLILAIITVPVGFVLTLMMSSEIISAGVYGSFSSQELWDRMRFYAVVISIVLSLLLYSFLGLMYTFMLKEIAPRDKRNLLWGGFILFLITGVISVMVTYISLPANIGNLSSTSISSASTVSDSLSKISSAASLIGIILYIMAYKSTREWLQRLFYVQSRTPQSDHRNAGFGLQQPYSQHPSSGYGQGLTSSAQKTCPNCGALVPAEYTVCPKCGAWLGPPSQ